MMYADTRLQKRDGRPWTVQLRVLKASALLVVLAVVSALPGANKVEGQEGVIRNYVPPSWQAEVVQWVRDQDGNGIDDSIDSLSVMILDAPNSVVTADIVVNYNACITDADTTLLASLAYPGTIQVKLKYIASVAVADVPVANIPSIVAIPKVAFVEQQREFELCLGVSVPNLCVTAGADPGICDGTVDGLGIDGTGVNIAIMDSGVDDLQHEVFATTPIIGGYNAITQTLGNPDDDNGHGTHMASIALGQGGTKVSRGVAPGAGLIDVKCVDAGGGVTWDWVRDALETIYDKHTNGEWQVDIILAPLTPC